MEAEIEQLLPDTYYNNRSLKFRIEKLVSDWQRAIKLVNKQEEQLDRAYYKGHEDGYNEGKIDYS